MVNKIDSNITALRFCEETALKLLAGDATDIWYALEPNSYSDFGGQLSTVARNPINPTRQKKKGTVTDLDASGGLNQDLTQTNSQRLFQGLMFADALEKGTTEPLKTTTRVAIVAVTATEVQAAAGLDVFKVGEMVLLSGFGVAANNGLKGPLTTKAVGAIGAPGLGVEAAPPATAKVEACGFRFDAADVSIVLVGGLPRLTSAGGQDMTLLGLTPGEWVYLGSNTVGARFANNVGFARINAIAAGYIEFDKTTWTPQNEVAGALTIDLYYGPVLRNAPTYNLFKRRTFQVERQVGSDANGIMSEYLLGACVNEFTLNVKQADKVTSDFTFVAVDNEQRTGLQGVKAGSRPAIVNSDCFNTSSDFNRIKLSKVDPLSSSPVPLFAFATELTITVNNNVSPNKAIGTLGAFDTTAGTFEVGGSITAYFADIEAVKAVRDNESMTLDVIVAKSNAGVVFDIPLFTLGDGRLNITSDEAIMVPLEINAAEGKHGHTFLVNYFPYLPDSAQA